MKILKQTYRNRINKYLDEVIRKYGYEHPATILFAQVCETFKNDPEKDNLLRHLKTTTLKYGADLK